MHQIGIPLEKIDWYQTGVNDPGRTEKVALKIPAGVRYTPVPDRSLTDLLLSKDLDALMTDRPSQAFVDGNPEIIRLFPDFISVEEAYWEETGIFPIYKHYSTIPLFQYSNRGEAPVFRWNSRTLERSIP